MSIAHMNKYFLWFELNLQFLQLLAQRLDYVSFENALEILVYLLAIINVSDDVVSLPVTLS